MTGGEPNLSFLGRWQSEQRCRNNPSPRLASSLNVAAPGRVAAGFPCASKQEIPPECRPASPTKVMMATLIFKMDLPSFCNPRPAAAPNVDGPSVLLPHSPVKK